MRDALNLSPKTKKKLMMLKVELFDSYWLLLGKMKSWEIRRTTTAPAEGPNRSAILPLNNPALYDLALASSNTTESASFFLHDTAEQIANVGVQQQK